MVHPSARRSSHVCFHSSVLGFTSQRVLPLLTVATISHASSVLGMDLVTLVDRGGEEHSFGITAVEAGFPERFHDLLKQCLVLCKVCVVPSTHIRYFRYLSWHGSRARAECLGICVCVFRYRVALEAGCVFLGVKLHISCVVLVGASTRLSLEFSIPHPPVWCILLEHR